MALIYPQNSDLTKLLKSARKKVPQSARLSAGGGGQKLKGQCPNAPSMNLRGASLTTSSFYKLSLIWLGFFLDHIWPGGKSKYRMEKVFAGKEQSETPRSNRMCLEK